MAPKLMSVKFTSNDHAEAFVRRHADNQNFPFKYEGFWCSGNRIPEDRAYYKQHLELTTIALRLQTSQFFNQTQFKIRGGF